MAYQLGGKAGFELVKEADERGVSPGSNVLAKLFKENAPCLILIDEWVSPTYMRQMASPLEALMLT